MHRRLLLFIRLYTHQHCRKLQQPFIRLKKISTSAKIFIYTVSGLGMYGFASPLMVLNKDTVSDSHIIEEADKLYNSSDFRNLYVFLNSHRDSTNCNILWRLARAARDLAMKSTDVKSDEKKRLIYEAFDSAKRALIADETNFAAHKWYAITIGDVGDYEGVKVKISNAYVIRDHLKRASELNPKDATTLHCLGMWCFAFADMPRWQHKIAGLLFGTPPTSTFKEAINYFNQAERVDPNFYSMNLLMLGKSYYRIGDLKRAMLYLDKASEYPCVTLEDENAKKESIKLLKEIAGKNK